MSQPLIAARNAPVRQFKARQDAAAARPELQVVTPPATRRARLPLPVACVLMLTLGLFGLLMTNIAIAGDAYRITDLQVKSQRLADQQQAAAEALAARPRPSSSRPGPRTLGMVPAPDAVHLTGSGVVGEPDAAPTAHPPAPVTYPATAARPPSSPSRPKVPRGPRVPPPPRPRRRRRRRPPPATCAMRVYSRRASCSA